MLVLTRRERESIVLGDEIILTVEAILDQDGRRLAGTKVRLGFECPRHVSIDRSECRVKVFHGPHAGGRPRPPAPRPGRLVELSDAQVRLSIQVPRRVPVCLNGRPTVGLSAEPRPGAAAHSVMAVHGITCRQTDLVTICKNISVAAVAFYRFVFAENDACQVAGEQSQEPLLPSLVESGS
jgi:carbon storage regulator CsrA